MNICNLKKSADYLKTTLEKYSEQSLEASRLYSDLMPLMRLVNAGEITTPLEWGQIPGRYRFSEKGLQEYEELESAFAHFCIEITGGETPALKWLRDHRRQNN